MSKAKTLQQFAEQIEKSPSEDDDLMELLSRFELLYVTASQLTYSWIEYGLRPEVSSSPGKKKNHHPKMVI